MKTWILKTDLSHSPQAAFRMYACGTRRSKLDINPPVLNTKFSQCFLASKIKSQLKSLVRLLDQNLTVGVERG